MAARKTVKAKVDKRLISEVTRFFGGWTTMLQEIVQNVYRSEAKRLDVTLDIENRLLEFEDDGVGCEDPQMLLSAGKTGWNQGKIKAPAGLGFFSLFDPSIVSNVVISSYDWQLVIPPELAVSKTFEVQRLNTKRKGFKIQLLLQEEFVVAESKDRWQKLHTQNFRTTLANVLTLYPFDMYLNGERVRNDEAESLRNAVQIHSERWGTIYLTRGGYSSRNAKVIWEHRLMESSVFHDALLKAAGDDPLYRWLVNRGSNQYSTSPSPYLTWQINTNCGVQPKLPDREDLINNGHLNRAVKAILSFVADWFDDGRHQAWPNVVRKTETLHQLVGKDEPESVSKTEHRLRNDAVAPILARHGWNNNEGEDLSDLGVCWEGDSVDITSNFFPTIWIKKGIAVSESDFTTLRNFSPELHDFRVLPTTVDKNSEQKLVPIMFEWDRPFTPEEVSEGNTIYVAPARSIQWNGYDLPYHFLSKEQREEFGVACIIRGTPEEVAEILEASFDPYSQKDEGKQIIFDKFTSYLLSLADDGQLFGQRLWDVGWEGDSSENDSDEAAINYVHMYAEIRHEFYSKYFPEKITLGQNLEYLVKVTGEIWKLKSAMTDLRYIADKHQTLTYFPKVEKIEKAIDAYSELIDKSIANIKKKLKVSNKKGK